MRKRSVVFASVCVMEQVAWNLCVAFGTPCTMKSNRVPYGWTPTTKSDSGMSSRSEK